MEINPLWFGGGLRRIAEGSLSWVSHDIKVALMGQSYLPSQTSQAFFSNVLNHEVDNPGYTPGGKPLTGRSVSQSGLIVTFKADDVVWEEVELSAQYFVIYRNTGSATTSPLIAYGGGEGAMTANRGDFSLKWGDGVLRIEAEAA